MCRYAATNLQRLLAEQGLSVGELARRAGVDERTVRALQHGASRPRPTTLHRIAQGLGVAVDEFFVDPRQLLYRCFDRATNPAVEEVMRTHRHLFEHWTAEDFDELHSRVGTGGGLTAEGALEMVHRMNQRNELHGKLDLILETTHGELLADMIELLFRKSQAAEA